MKFVILFVLLSLTVYLGSSSTPNNHLKTANQIENLANFACEVTRDVVSSQPHTQDVLIGNMAGKSQASMIKDITKRIGDENSVIVTDLKAPMTGKSLRKASVVILVVDDFDANSVQSLIVNHQFSKVLHYMTKLLIVATKNMSINRQHEILRGFSNLGFIDVAITFETFNEFFVSTLETVHGNTIQYKNLYDGRVIFADKLKNLRGYAYRIFIYNEPPRVIITDTDIKTPIFEFVKTVAEIQNARIELIQLVVDYSKLADIWFNREMDLTFNTGTSYPNAPYPKLLTYEETGFCALAPRPPKIHLSEMIYVKPFDKFTWMCLFLTIGSCAVVWRLFRHRGAVDSHWLLVYGIFVMFIGQGVDFSRRNRMVLAILLQLIILMIFVLSSAYEGVITSFMIQPEQENRFERFDQILASKYEIMTDEAFGYAVKDSEEFMTIKSRMNTSAIQMKGKQYGLEIRRQHYVFVKTCESAEIDIKYHFSNGEPVTDYYYLLPERIIKYYLRLEASFLNPFIERLQYYMDLSFQAGLPQIWKVFASQSILDNTHQQHTPDADILKLTDLVQVFYVLFIGYGLATCVFLIEIFFHDFLRNLQFAYLGRRLRNRVNQMVYKKKAPKHQKYQRGALYYIIRQHKKVKRLRKLKVRKIFIQPRNIEH